MKILYIIKNFFKILSYAILFSLLKTQFLMWNSRDHYINASAAGIALILNFFLILFFQAIPFAFLHSIFKLKVFNNRTFVFALLSIGVFLSGGIYFSTFNIESHDVHLIPKSFFLDFLLCYLYLYKSESKSQDVRRKTKFIYSFIFLFVTFTTVYYYRIAERYYDLLILNQSYSSRRDRLTLRFDLYDNLNDESLLPFISFRAIKYYPEIKIAVVAEDFYRKYGLINIQTKKYIYPATANSIGVFSGELFAIETDDCPEIHSNHSFTIYCKSGYINQFGDWKINPIYYFVSNFETLKAKVGVLDLKQPHNLKYVCIDPNGKILNSVDEKEECH